MTAPPVFVLDANVFMEASRRYYAFDLAPAFWDALVLHSQSGRIESIDLIQKELERGNDHLARWVNEFFLPAFVSTDENSVITSYGTIINWVNAQKQFFDAAKAEFAKSPDGWLIAYAKTKNRTIVTHEVINPDIKRKVPIPNACEHFSVTYIDTFEMMRQLKIQL